MSQVRILSPRPLISLEFLRRALFPRSAYRGYFTMGGASIGMDTVFEVGLKLPDVEESPYYGARALKLHGQMVACTPVNKSAEVNSVVVAMSMKRRAALLK